MQRVRIQLDGNPTTYNHAELRFRQESEFVQFNAGRFCYSLRTLLKAASRNYDATGLTWDVIKDSPKRKDVFLFHSVVPVLNLDQCQVCNSTYFEFPKDV